MKKAKSLKEVIKKHADIVKQAGAELTKMRNQLKKLIAQDKADKKRAKSAKKPAKAKRRAKVKK